MIGIPLRLTVSAKSLSNGGGEMKRRDQKKFEIVPEANLVTRVQTEVDAMLDEIALKVVEVPFK